MQTARLTKRPIIHVDENVDVNPAAKRLPLADKAVIAADKENSQVARKVVKKAAATTAVLAPRNQAKPAAPVRAALSEISTSSKPATKDAAPPTKSLSLAASKATAKPKSVIAPTLLAEKPIAPLSMLNISFQEADMEPMLIDNKFLLPPGIDDIDAGVADPTLSVSEYANDIYDFYFSKEKEVQPSPTYLRDSTEITAEMRTVLVDWLIEVHQRLMKIGDALFLNVYLIDRFLSLLAAKRRSFQRQHFQLLGVACLLIASKIEEVTAISVMELCQLCDFKIQRQDIVTMENFVLNVLGFNLTVPTSLQFLRRFTRAGKLAPEVHMLARYLLESTLCEYSMLQFMPSMIAASAVYLAKRLTEPLNDDVWTPTLAYYTKYEEADILPCATALNEMLKRRPTGEPKTLPMVQRKYLSRKYYQVAAVKPLEEL